MLTIHSGTPDSVSISSFAVQNTDSPTRLPGNADPNFPDVSLASASLITSSEWQTHTTMSSDHLPILIGLQTTATSSPARHRTYINLKKADWTGYKQEIEHKLSSRHLQTDCQKDEKLFQVTLLKAASHHIPNGRRKLHTQQVPAEILAMMEERDDLRKQIPVLDKTPEPRVPLIHTHSLQPHLTQIPHQHCRHPPTLTLSQHTHMQHKQQYMHHSHRNNCTHNIGYYDNLTNRPRTTTGLLTPHKHTGPAVKVREISSYCKST